MVVFGLYGNSTSHFELASSRHMRESGALTSQCGTAASLRCHMCVRHPGWDQP